MTYIHELSGWPDFTWDAETLAAPIAAVRHDQGRLSGWHLALPRDAHLERASALRS